MDLLVAVLSGFLVATLAPFIRGRLRDYAGWLLAVLPAGLTLYFISLLLKLANTPPAAVKITWAPVLGIDLALRADGLGLLFALLISGIGMCVAIYAQGYLKGDPRLNRFYAWLFIFMASMLGVVLADNIILLFVFWELTSFSSFLLIGFNHDEPASRAAALQALLVTGSGGLAMLAGLVLLGQVSGSFEISALLSQGEAVKSSTLYLPILILILLGAFTKSAQFPFHFWLPNAMQAPTPVSAYLHSATMVKAGIYLLARLSPVLGSTNEWLYLVASAGAVTMLAGGILALLQTDLKRLLAYSTVSALGMMVHLLGLGSPLAVKAAMGLLLAHALYKGALFLVAGAVDHESGSRDVRRLGGLGRAMPITAIAGGLAGLSMAGLPPTLGFIAKETFYETGLELSAWLASAAVLTAVLNVYVAGAVGLEPFWIRKHEAPKVSHDAPLALWLGPLLLAGLSLFFGLFPGAAGKQLLSPTVTAILGKSTVVKLALWHGFTTALYLSMLTVILGAGLFLARNRVRQIAARINWPWGPDRIYTWALDGLNWLAAWQTRVLQSGYLRVYLTVIILTTIGLAGYSLVAHPTKIVIEPREARFYEVILAGVIVLATLMATRSRSRLAAVAALGIVGYGLSVIYLLYGAPDLAMIQFAIETLTVILLILVVYRLPKFTRLTSPPARLFDILIALAGGCLMTILVLVVYSYPLMPQLTPFFIENSLALAKGRNVVNVILVDFRGFDTLGEITVLGTAAIGVYSLIRLTSPRAKQQARQTQQREKMHSLILQTSVRWLMPLLLIFSVFLLIRGHNELGGGFTGGVVASAAFMLYAIAVNPAATRAMVHIKPRLLIGLGLLVALSSGILAIINGLPFMTGLWLPQEVAVIGKVGTPLLFDLGVYLAVIGVNLHILLNLMEEKS
ncbi:MAG: putative monovalent cation/H+ antiporter subunit A [Anaerolineales bacterium]|nr:putative monovalent cation/H+ antiporter subunit A [Anaerolineales bacterium]